MMKRQLIFLALLISLFVVSTPRPTFAYCTCYDTNDDPYVPEGAEEITEDGACNNACEDANFDVARVVAGEDEDAQQAQLDAESEIASGQAATAQEELAGLENQNLGYCYCGDTTNGAQLEGDEGGSATVFSKESCDEACDIQGKQTAAFGASIATFPISNALCFTQEECDVVSGSWSDAQPAECEKNYHYCYPEQEPITLSVNLGGITTVLDIGTYISAIFNYGLGIAAIIAVIMIMIGGMQYIIGSRGGGGSEEVSKGKERIKNAIIGLVLILASYTLLATVNPALVRFKILRLPLIKPTLFIAGSCEDFIGQGYRVSPESGECGGEDGVLLSDANGTKLTGSCHFDSCGDPNVLCAKKGDEYDCLSCDDAGETATLDAGFQASPANCSVLTPIASNTKKDRCVFYGTEDGDVSNAFQRLGYFRDLCARIEVNCSSISTCNDYSNVRAFVGGTALGGQDPVSGVNTNAAEDNGFDDDVRSICEDDPCGKFPSGCTYVAEPSLGAATCQ